jgi:hypothetical protein
MKQAWTALVMTALLSGGAAAYAQSVDFGSVALTMYKDSAVTVTNTYPFIVAVTSTTMLHSPSDFAITGGGAPFSVLPNATHTTSMRFTPSRLGLITDSVVVVTALGTVYVEVYGTGIALPVELERFAAARAPEGVLLRWRTAAESGNAGFEVQRAIRLSMAKAGPQFERIAFVAGHGTTRDANDYSFLDTHAGDVPGGELVYRLRQVDYDGSSTLSPELAVDVPADGSGLTSVAPVPLRDAGVVRYRLATPSHVVLSLHDALGREVACLHDGFDAAGSYAVPITRGKLSAGWYLIRLAHDGAMSFRALHID